jgi:hypothetical protein
MSKLMYISIKENDSDKIIIITDVEIIDTRTLHLDEDKQPSLFNNMIEKFIYFIDHICIGNTQINKI